VKKLGEVRNRAHDGLFVVICDSMAEFGGWDEYGEMLADEGSTELDLDGLRAFVEEAHGSGHHEVFASEDGTIWINPPIEPGVMIPLDRIEHEPRTQVVERGVVDVPSGTLTIALAYPPLNMTARGDHAGVMHDDGERLDIPTDVRTFSVRREFTASGQIVALRCA
jgi:hypothetical protein